MNDIKDQVMELVNSSVNEIMTEQMQNYISMFKLEVEMLNEELANNTHIHGYDFVTIPEDLVNSLVIQPVSNDENNYSICAFFDNDLLNNCSDSLIDFIQEYAIENTNLRYMRYGSGG